MRRRLIAPLFFILAAGLSLLAACGSLSPDQPAPASPSTTASATATRTPTPTPSSTPTPTASAPPAAISGDARSLAYSEPVRQGGAPCGYVDTFDFPLDPPDGEQARGGGDFGRYRDRYDGYHAGEDWRLGSASLGKPVYSIGHGRVVYAQPLGWGPDKGVIIVEHTFRDRQRLLSFYGHLDPPSVVLRAGQCVERGDQIAAIGDPRTRPHLHFELRVHLPDTPGPGYWPVDPRLAGWWPPSATIWSERMAALPGVGWTWVVNEGTAQVLGVWGDSLLLLAEQQLLALDLADGTRRWSSALPETADHLLLDAARELIYAESFSGLLEAFRLEDIAGRRFDDSIRPVWQLELDAGSHQLAPLPDGGLVAISRSGTAAVSSDGELLWKRVLPTDLIDWAHSGEALLLLARDSVWVVDHNDAAQWNQVVGGERLVASTQPYLYANDGVYRLDMERELVERFFKLPSGFARLGDLAEFPGGGIALVHRDLDDTRLLAIDAAGSLRWERSIRALNPEASRLVTFGDELFLMVQYGAGNSTGFDIFRVGLDDGALLRIFSGGTRSDSALSARPLASGNQLLLVIPGVGAVAWEPTAAIEASAEH